MGTDGNVCKYNLFFFNAGLEFWLSGAPRNTGASVSFPNGGFSHIKGQVAMGFTNIKLPPPIVCCLGQGEKMEGGTHSSSFGSELASICGY